MKTQVTQIKVDPRLLKRCSDDLAVHGLRLELKPNGQVADFEPEWSRLQKRWHGKTKGEVRQEGRIARYREFLKEIDRTTEPSIEALIKRFLLPDELRFPVIHPIVDAVNIAAVDRLIPLGVFDADCVTGDIELGLTKGGEPFHALGAPKVESLEPGDAVLRDHEKVLSRFCYRDAYAQKITDSTRKVWLLACQVPGVEVDLVTEALDRATELLRSCYNVKNVT